MNDATRNYLQGRFRDYYRRTDVDTPPKAEEREWGVVPWTKERGEIFERHKALVDMGDLQDFLASNSPKHVYFSASQYKRPAARNMSSKEWKSSDLIFDIDAKDIPRVEENDLTYREELEESKKSVKRLLYFLKNDFHFEDITVVFSGGQGYHVHVRDDHIQELESQQRTQIVNYIKGKGFDPSVLIERLQNQETFVQKIAVTAGGWNKLVLNELSEFADVVLDKESEAAQISYVKDYHSEIDDDSAKEILETIQKYDLVIKSNLLPNERKTFADTDEDGLEKVVRLVSKKITSEMSSMIDEPVTTDVNRLIRFPGSLHGGTGFRVSRIETDNLSDFDPFVDAVPEVFTTHDITVNIKESGEYEVGDVSMEVDEGKQKVPEQLGIYLMAQRFAEKLPE